MANESASVFHVFAFQWKQGTSEAQKERAKKEIAAFQGLIPGLLQTHVGPKISPRGKGYAFGGIMQFKDKVSLDAYVQHPSHQDAPDVAYTADRCNRIGPSRMSSLPQLREGRVLLCKTLARKLDLVSAWGDELYTCQTCCFLALSQFELLFSLRNESCFFVAS